MPENSWLAQEYIGSRLQLALMMKKRVSLREFKLLFMIPVEDEKILQLARELGFRISKRHRGIVIELDPRRGGIP